MKKGMYALFHFKWGNQMLLADLLKSLEYEVLCGSADIDITGIKNDSRKVGAGDLFFCIKGAVSDGHTYAPQVIAAGCAALLVEDDITKDEALYPAGSAATVIRVKSTRYAMGCVSSVFYGEPSKKLTVIGITGTKGKTTSSYMIHDMLERAGIKTGLIGTIEVIDGKERIHADNTTPESIILHKHLYDMVENGCKAVVMEVSSQGLMLDRVAGVDFDYGIFTNLTKDHIGPNEHKTFEEYMGWKAKLFTLCKTGIFNADDPHMEDMTKTATCKILTFGMKAGCDYTAEDTELYREKGVMGTRYRLSGKLSGEVTVALPGEFSVHNSLCAVAVAHQLNVPQDVIFKILHEIRVRGRVEMIPISDKYTLMLDYAHNGVALESLIIALRAYQPKRLVVLFGCGGNRSKDRRYEMGEVAGRLADLSIITSDNPRFEEPQDIINDIRSAIEKTDGKFVEIIDRKEAMRYAILHAEEGDVIVFAGKGHEDYQEIKGVKHPMDERVLIEEILKEEGIGGIR